MAVVLEWLGPRMANKQEYPSEVVIDGATYRFERTLKSDGFSSNWLYRDDATGRRYVLKAGRFKFFFGPLLAPLARALIRREYENYRALQGIDGIPRLGPWWGKAGFFHEFVEGQSLHDMGETPQLPPDFIEKLRALVDQLHARRLVHLDLNKRGNIILTPQGAPCIIDFQVSLRFPAQGRRTTGWVEKLFNLLKAEDIYHVYKHKKRLQPLLMTQEDKARAERTAVGFHWLRSFAKRYRKIKRATLYPKGSNETVWYKWRKLKGGKRQTD